MVSAIEAVSLAFLLLANVSKGDRDWNNQEVMPRNRSSSLLQAKVGPDDCEEGQRDSGRSELCCPTNLRYSHPRLHMTHIGCDCFCGMEKEAECWDDPTRGEMEQRAGFPRKFGDGQMCCSQQQALGPHRRLVSEISECNCWCGQGAQEGEKLFGPDSWTHKLALRTLAATQTLNEDGVDTDGDGTAGSLAASLNAVGKFTKRKNRRKRLNGTAINEEAARLVQKVVGDEIEFLGHKVDKKGTEYLSKVIDEYENLKRKAGSDPNHRDWKIPDFTEFVGPELMSLYMDKARAAMLSERDVREQSDKVVAGLIGEHRAFRNRDLEWADRQNSFNDLLSHAENYLQHTDPGRVEDRMYMGEALVRPISNEPGKHWGSLESLPRPRPALVIAPPSGKSHMYRRTQQLEQPEYTGTLGITPHDDGERREASLRLNMAAHRLTIDSVAHSVELEAGAKPGEIKITWTEASDERRMQLNGIIDGETGRIRGSGVYKTPNLGEDVHETERFDFDIAPTKAEAEGTWCGTRKSNLGGLCCPEHLKSVDPPTLMTRGNCRSCICGKLP